MDSISNRYAIALLSIARDEKKVNEYLEEIKSISSIFDENEELTYLLKSFGLSNDEKKSAIDAIFKDRVREYILNLFYVMIDNSRGGYIHATLNEFIRLAYKDLNIKKGIVYTTIPLTLEQLEGLNNKVSKMLNSNVSLDNVIDKDLLGGFKIQVEDYLLDDSLKNRLYKLKESIILKKGEND